MRHIHTLPGGVIYYVVCLVLVCGFGFGREGGREGEVKIPFWEIQ
jgi:hypothetical protein